MAARALTTLIAARIKHADLARLLNICLHLQHRHGGGCFATREQCPAATRPGKDDRCLGYFRVAAARRVRESENAPANASGSVSARVHTHAWQLFVRSFC